MNNLNTPSDTLTLESIEAQLRSLAANLSGDVGFDDLEMRHLLDILSKSTLLLREGYDPETLDRILWGEGRPAEFLGADLRAKGGVSGSRLFRLWNVPDVLRNYGDKCLYDVGFAGRTTFRGVILQDLGPRAYNLAGQVLELLADDRMLRDFFEHNTMECLPIDQEVTFLRQCASRFRLYAQILQALRSGDTVARIPALPAPPGGPGGLPVHRRPAEPRPHRIDLERGERGDPEPGDVSAAAPPSPDATIPVEDREERLTALERAVLFSSLDLVALRRRLKEIVVDQPQAVDQICDDMAVYALGTRSRPRPQSYFLVGPTGVGKNYMMESLARQLGQVWGIDLPFLVLEGPQFTYPSDVSELKGSTRGFIRSDEEGILAEFHHRARVAPLSIVLVDEVEKAHPQLTRFFLSLMDRGATMDNRGRLLRFPATILAFTSNLGYSEQEMLAQPIGYGAPRSGPGRRRSASRSLRRGLPPEFLNRLHVIHFAPLTRSSAERILDQELRRLDCMYRSRHRVAIEVTAAARVALVDEGFSEEFGARHLIGRADRFCNIEVGLRLGHGAEPLSERGRSLLVRIREARAGRRAFDEQALSAEVEDEIRSGRRAGRIIVDREGDRYVYRVETT